MQPVKLVPVPIEIILVLLYAGALMSAEHVSLERAVRFLVEASPLDAQEENHLLQCHE